MFDSMEFGRQHPPTSLDLSLMVTWLQHGQSTIKSLEGGREVNEKRKKSLIDVFYVGGQVFPHLLPC